MSKMKEIAVIGLGKFGRSVAQAYSKAGGMVLAIDADADKIQEIADVVTYAVRADVTDAEAVRTLGLSNVDVAIVAITDNLEASVMATILSKEEGVPYVMVKAQNEVHAKVLRKVGADKIIFPEKEMGIRIARNLKMDHLTDIVDLSDEYSIIEGKVPKDWVGKNIMELCVRRKYGLNIIGIRYEGEVELNVPPNVPLKEDMTLIVIGENEKIDSVFHG